MNIKKLLAITFLIILFLPFLQRKFSLFPKTTLAGVIMKKKNPDFTLQSWLQGTFQKANEKRFISKLGFRAHLIKTENQINYSLFNYISAKPQEPIIMGEQGWLYEESYIRNYIKPKKVNRQHVLPYLQGVAELQEHLNKRGKAFALIISASKASTYPENLPAFAKELRKKVKSDNYQQSVELFKELKINFVDTPEIFTAYKKQNTPLLFAKGGTHWNYLGAFLIVQAMSESIASQLKFSIPQLKLSEIIKDKIVAGTDNDLGELLNIWTKKKTIGDNYHPVFDVSITPGIKKPKILFVGCSFVLTLSELLDNSGFYEERDTLYYYKRLISFPGDTNPPQTINPVSKKDFDLPALLEKADAVILEINETILPLGWMEFVRDADNYFRNSAN